MRPRRRPDGERDRRGVPAIILRWLLDPVFYYLGLNDRDGHPSNAKVLYTSALAVNLVCVLAVALRQVAADKSLGLWWTLYAIGVMAFAGGHHLFAKFLSSKLAAQLAGAAGQVGEAEAKAQAAIAERRRAGADEGIEATP